ncbi:aromatic-L-amino-acid decarboxylase-like [Fopius arisanus]|uniref:Aromatic-L-amino-acid decarboxylase-like n=1 Tax=Fopius arisanus TaxID=64838 RepID=A0A9R1TS29_9HYME|nr:PREDICTED: aromatic-L-amino-acid decarboxylase-like [Fopius arisanus]
MDAKDFIEFGKASLEFIVNYNDTIRNRNVLPSVQPGFLKEKLPAEAPEVGETWQEVLKDVKEIIVPGITHWNSPNFHAYFPCGTSYPAIIGELMCAGLSTLSFSWMSSPAVSELEDLTMNWLGRAIGLPEQFLSDTGKGGRGMLESSASETTMICLLAAKTRTLRRIKTESPHLDHENLESKLVAYTSEEANSSVEKAGVLGSMKMKLLPAQDDGSLNYLILINEILKDIEIGLIPCYMVANIGTTGTCAFDNLTEIGHVCRAFDIWLHVDAAYAGGAFVCPEYRYLMNGVGYVDSFNFNPHKWLLTNYDCSALWVQHSHDLIETFQHESFDLTHAKENEKYEYKNWQIAQGRRFRALKLWFVMRMYGVEGLQDHIQEAIALAKKFEDYVNGDERFEIVTPRSLGLICFRMKGEDALTQDLLKRLMRRKIIYVISATHRGRLMIRFAVCTANTTEADIEFAWKEITEQSDMVLQCSCHQPSR